MRHLVFLCAAIAGFGITLERPSNHAEARRRCCSQRYRYSDNCCHSGYYQNGGYYQSGNYQTCGTQQYQTCGVQYANQCGQTYGTVPQNQTDAYAPDGSAAPPPPAPAPDGRSTYYRGGTLPQRGAANVVPPAAPRPAAPPAPSTTAPANTTVQQ